MPEEKKHVVRDESPTSKKIRAIMRGVTTGDIEFETVIPQAILTILIVGGAVYMTVVGQPVPDWLVASAGAIIGFYFGSDYQYRREAKKGK